MASFTFSSSVIKISLSLLLLILFLVPSTTAGGATATNRPSPLKCIHHHASLTACERFLKDVDGDGEKQLPQPTEACCNNYNGIFYGGTPACLCRYLLPEKLKTSFNVTKLMSLHDFCGSSNSVSLYDLCVGTDGNFNGIIEVADRDRVNHPRTQPSLTSD